MKEKLVEEKQKENEFLEHVKNWFYRFQHYAFSISYTVNKRSKFNFFTCS